MAVITADEVAVDLLARYDKLERQLQKADSVVDRRLGGMEGRAQAFASRFSGALAGVSVAALATEFLKLSDVSKQIEAQLRLATSSFGSFAQAQTDVQRLTAATRGELSATAALYGNFVRASQESGKSQEDAARATETFAKALKIGGAGAAETASATLQFSQALASGVLRGDEFNSIMEASPRIARLLADALGVPIGSLRKMAEQGKITRDVLFNALTGTKFTAGIDDEFKTLPVTFADAMQQVENSAVTTFGAFDRGGQFSTALANFITDGSDGFKGLAVEAEQTGVDIRATLAGLYDAFNPMLEGARSVFSLIGGDARSVVEQVRGDISFILGAIDRFSNLGNGAEKGLRGAANGLVDRGLLPSGFRSQMAPASDFQGRFDRGFADRQQTGRNATFRRALGAEGAFNLNKPGGTRVLAPPPPRATPSSVGADKSKGRGPSASTAARQAETQRLAALRNDETFEREKSGLQQDLLRARQSMATSADTVAQYELQEIEASRARQNGSYQRDVSEKKLTQARADELITLNDQLAAQRRSGVQVEQEQRARAARAAIAQGDLTNARDLASAEADIAVTARDRRATALRVLDLEYRIERSRLDAVVASEQSTEAEREVARRRLAVLPQMEANDRGRVERQTSGPLEGYRERLRSEVGDMNTALEGVAVDGLDTLTDGLAGVVSGTGSVGDAFSKMATSIIADLARIAIQKAILRSIEGAAGGTGGGGIGGLLDGLFGGPRAAGGPVSAGKTYLVGERGPELLRMNGAGTVIPNDRITTANPAALGISSANVRAQTRPGTVVVNQSFHADMRGALTFPEFVSQFKGYVDGQARQAGAAAVVASTKMMPGTLAQYDKLGG